jgi:hypothetical protein
MLSCLPKNSSMAPSIAATIVATRYNVEVSSDMNVLPSQVLRTLLARSKWKAPAPAAT